jgi:cell shape-determining protein MreC
MIEGVRTQDDQRSAGCGFAPNRSGRSSRNAYRRLTSPPAALAAGLALAVALMLAPDAWSTAMKGRATALLRPGQLAVSTVRRYGAGVVALAKSHFGTAAQLAESERRRERLAEENGLLAAELTVARSGPSDPTQSAPDDSFPPLLTSRCVEARVLGELARAFLGRRHLLDIGSQSGVQPGAPVVHAPPEIIDQGLGAGLEAGHLVLSRRRIWGKVVEVGRSTSVVRTVTEPDYRDLVQLGPTGPQGILEGTGGPLARVRLVEVTEPVAVGDPVYSAAGAGLLTEPLFYGQVVRLERPVGAAHWEIWIELAPDPKTTDHVAVLRIKLNPLRLADREASGDSQIEK